jgi:hypothetical protein
LELICIKNPAAFCIWRWMFFIQEGLKEEWILWLQTQWSQNSSCHYTVVWVRSQI